MNNNKKISKGLVATHAFGGIVFVIYVIICMLKNFENFDGVVFGLYFMTILPFQEDFLKNNIIKYTFYIILVLLLIFLIHKAYNFII